jgi:hypothetical protein
MASSQDAQLASLVQTLAHPGGGNVRHAHSFLAMLFSQPHATASNLSRQRSEILGLKRGADNSADALGNGGNGAPAAVERKPVESLQFPRLGLRRSGRGRRAVASWS